MLRTNRFYRNILKENVVVRLFSRPIVGRSHIFLCQLLLLSTSLLNDNRLYSIIHLDKVYAIIIKVYMEIIFMISMVCALQFHSKEGFTKNFN